MKILIIVSGYPSEDNLYNCTWAHTRSKYYQQAGIELDVLSFQTRAEYVFEGIRVLTLESAVKNIKRNTYDLVISHSPNIRNHLPFLERLRDIPVIFFMHGSESMSYVSDYPKPYFWRERSIVSYLSYRLYDKLRFKLLKRYIIRNRKKLGLVFVSSWLRKMFEKNVMKLGEDLDTYTINNSLGASFLENTYELNEGEVKADYITIRSLDNSKYALDLVVSFAKANPQNTFHIYGKGTFFDYIAIPENVIWFDTFIPNEKIPALLNDYRYALMPTKCDAQGVMACEMAAYGMPLITTDIEVNREMFDGFGNVKLLEKRRYEEIYEVEKEDFSYNFEFIKNRFSFSATIGREIALIHKHRAGAESTV